jgi:histidine ammonia-lyase
MPDAVTLDHRRRLSLVDIRRVASGKCNLVLNRECAALLDQRREEVLAKVRRQAEPAYGFNRGFGHNVNLPVDGDEGLLAQLQRNLIRSHAMGLGQATPRRIVRTAMVLRANSLCRGHSAVRSVVVEKILQLLNAQITPVVPRHGSVSASGDLAPLSHIALALIGEGTVFAGSRKLPAAEALAEAGIEPLTLQMKEGLALNNGAQFICAIGIDVAQQLTELLKTATIATSLSTQAMLGSATPFREDLHRLRPHPGALVVSRWLRALLSGSPIQDVHRDIEIDGEIQDPYNIRCAAQILGACWDLIDEAERTFELEANSVTDNPLLLQNRDTGEFTEIVSGGHFHGMPLAVKLYNLMQACGIIARLSNMRCVRFVDETRNKGLGPDLIWPGLSAAERSASSGMMASEYASASLTNWIWGQAMPSHLFSVSTDAGQEDHVSMGAPLGLRLLDTIPRLAEVLAVELAFASQAAAIRRYQQHFPSKTSLPQSARSLAAQFVAGVAQVIASEEQRDLEVQVDVRKLYPWRPEERRMSQAGEAVLAEIQHIFPVVTEDRVMSEQITTLAKRILDGTINRAADPFAAFEAEPPQSA